MLVCGKVLPNEISDASAAPNCAPGAQFGEDLDLAGMLTKLNSEKDPDAPEYRTLESVINHAAYLVPHLPIESHDLPSMGQLQMWSQNVQSLDTQEALNQHLWNYAKREELVLQLVNAMSHGVEY